MLLVAFLLPDFFFELRMALLADFFLVDLAFEAGFFLVTFFRASFRLAFDLPALAFFLLTFFFDFLPDFLAGFLLDFLVGFLLVFFLAFLLDFLVFFLPDRATPRLREVFFADFLETRFFEVAFLVGMRGDPGWLEMQPAIIHRTIGCGSLPELYFSARDSGQCDGLCRIPTRVAMFGDDGRIDPPADVESGGKPREPRPHSGDQIVEDLVGDGLVEGADVTKRPDI